MANDWFKMHSRGWLTGSIRAQLTPSERSVWADLLAMANESRVRGIICRAKGIPYTREYIANYLGIPLDLLNSTIDKCVRDENADDPTTRISFDDVGCIIISNWSKYQDKPEPKPKENRKSEEARLQILRFYANKYPDVALDVVLSDFGYNIVNKKTGEICETVKDALNSFCKDGDTNG